MSKPIVVKVFRNGGVVDVKQFVHEQQIIIGSSDADTHIRLEGQVSPFHASIERRGDKYILSDLGTPQGTYLKGSKILESALEHGDKIAVGEYILEFYVGAPTVSASSGPTVAPAAQPAPIAVTHSVAPSYKTSVATTPAVTAAADAGMEAVSSRPAPQAKATVKGVKTFAPNSHYKDLGEFVRPTKGSTVEVLVSWKERVINSYHFHQKGTFYYGSHPSCDILVPSLTTKVNRAPLVQIDGQASVYIPPGMAGSLVVGNQSVPLTQLYAQGRLQSTGGGGSKLNLAQG
ncbi:MAG: FHA domain-containing protein, partial [Bdellovibrionaceae bacterium]|nr:FHA domain-containing protein [Pseudobdellovibrionaceae bacterium]